MKFLSGVLVAYVLTTFAYLPLRAEGEDLMDQPLEKMTVEAFSKSPWTDHTLAFEEVFKVIPVKGLLEFGLGLSTKIFLDKVPSVASLELGSDYTLRQSLSWYKRCVKRFMSHFPHWRPSFRQGSDEVCEYTVNAYTKKTFPETLQKAYLQEISDACTQGLALLDGNCTLAFVDSGVYGRGDLVNELLSRKIPIVAAHDTIAVGWEGLYYGYDRISPPKEYVSIIFPVRRGITFWFRQDLVSAEKISKLRQAAKLMESLDCLKS